MPSTIDVPASLNFPPAPLPLACKVRAMRTSVCLHHDLIKQCCGLLSDKLSVMLTPFFVHAVTHTMSAGSDLPVRAIFAAFAVHFCRYTAY